MVTTISWPTFSFCKAGSEGSIVRLSPDKVAQAGKPPTLMTDRTAPESTSEAPSSRFTVTTAESSAPLALTAPATTGASLVPVMVSVAVCGTDAPCSSVMS